MTARNKKNSERDTTMKMNYTVLGTNNLEAATTFYDALFAGSDVAQIGKTDRMVYWQVGEAAFAVATPFDQEEATSGNGTMIGFDAGSPEEVDRLYDLALELGGMDEGAPSQKGPRYSGYVRDLDHNKLCFYA